MKQHILYRYIFILFVSCCGIRVYSQEIKPALPWGGERQVREFLDEEMLYPEDAIKQLAEGTVILNFKVSAQGTVSDVEVSEPVHDALKREGIRLFRMILWEPAEYRGKAIESKVRFEIPFSLKRYKKACKLRGYAVHALPDARSDSSGKVYTYRDTDQPPMPAFEDTKMNMQTFMAENFIYPEDALRRNITGIVKVNFIVEAHGRISNVRITEYLGAGCAEEAVRLIKKIPWKPGLRDGKTIRVNMTVPITFGLGADGGYHVTPAAGGTSFQ